MSFMNKATLTGQSVSCSTTTAVSTVLAVGYNTLDNLGPADIFIRQGGSAVVAVATTARRLPAGAETVIFVSDSNDAYVAAITSASTATLRIHQVG